MLTCHTDIAGTKATVGTTAGGQEELMRWHQSALIVIVCFPIMHLEKKMSPALKSMLDEFVKKV